MTGKKILEALGAGSTAIEASVQAGCSKANVTYWKNKLLRWGAIDKQTTGAYKTYSITPFGLKLLTGSDSVVEAVVLEDYAMKFAVLQWGRGARLNWKPLGSPKNWRKFGIKVEGVRVVKTSRGLIIHPGKMRGFDVDELLAESGRVIERIIEFLYRRFDVVLAEEGVPIKKPVFRFYTAEANEDIKHCTAILHDAKTGERLGATDNSGDLPHEEYDSRERAIRRQMLPDTVRGLEKKVDALVELVNVLTKAQGKTADSLNKFVDLLQAKPQANMKPTPLKDDYAR